MELKTPREQLRETLDANRREMESWPQWLKDAPPVFDSRPDQACHASGEPGSSKKSQ